TQNPIEHEGTYPLPEAQLDRFFFNLLIDYPGMDEEEQIVRLTTGKETPVAEPILTPEEVVKLQDATIDVPVPDHVLRYILKLTHASRPQSEHALDFVKDFVAYGAGPRASQNLTRAARALALLRGSPAASVEEVDAVARPVLRHRIVPNYNATGEGITVEDLIDRLLAGVEA
ncbi:MAG: MoxR family ATPase, partial [Verrucomicrobiota bacterium]